MASDEDPPAVASTSSPKKRFERELNFLEDLYKDRDVGKPPTNGFVKNIMDSVQKTVDEYQTTFGEIDTVESKRHHMAVKKSLLYTLRRIVTAWKKYPIIGSDFMTTQTSAYDFRMTALHVVKDTPDGSLEKKLASIFATAVDPSEGDETPQHTQARIDNLILAAKNQYYLWADDMLADETFSDYKRDDPVLSEDEAEPLTYSMSKGPDTLNPPSDPSKILPQAADVDNELDERQIIYATGRVLRTKADKVSYASEQEKEAAAKAKADLQAAKQSASAQKAQTFRNTAPSDAQSDDDDTTVPTTMPAGKGRAATKKRVASASDETSPAKRTKKSKVAGPTKKSSIEDDESDGIDNVEDGNAFKLKVAPNQNRPGGNAIRWLRDEDDWGRQLIIDHPDWPMPTIYREFNLKFANTAYQDASMATHEYRSDYVRFPTSDPNKDNKMTRDYDLFHRSYQSVRQHFEKFKREVALKPPTPPTWDPLPENLAANLPPRIPPPRPDVFRDPNKTPVPRPGQDSTHPTSGARARVRKAKQAPTSLVEDDDDDDQGAPTGLALLAPSTTSSPNRSVNTFSGVQYYQTRGWTPINAPVSGSHTPYSPPAPRRVARAAAEGNAGLLSTIDPRAHGDMTDPKNFANKGAKGWKSKKDSNGQNVLNFLQPQTQETMSNSGAQEDVSSGGSGRSAPGDALVDTLEDFVAQQSDDNDDGEVETAAERPMSLMVVLRVPGEALAQFTQFADTSQRSARNNDPGDTDPSAGSMDLEGRSANPPLSMPLHSASSPVSSASAGNSSVPRGGGVDSSNSLQDAFSHSAISGSSLPLERTSYPTISPRPRLTTGRAITLPPRYSANKQDDDDAGDARPES